MLIIEKKGNGDRDGQLTSSSTVSTALKPEKNPYYWIRLVRREHMGDRMRRGRRCGLLGRSGIRWTGNVLVQLSRCVWSIDA
jgi:hypothetical protein